MEIKPKYNMKIIKLLIVFATLILGNNSFAQKQANIWHFADGKSLDFSSGAPVNVTGSQIFTYEGCASYCDKYGNFLFYTNGGGRELGGLDSGTIWNRNNAVMYNMKGTEGGGFSSAQSSVIFEAPGQDSVYYVFTMDEVEWDVGATPTTIANQPGGRGLSYFTVDMRLNGGLGGVVLADQRLHTPSGEGLCAIRHANKRDYWVLFHKGNTGLGVYLVTPTGITFNGVYTNPLPSAPSPIVASPNGDYVITSFVTNGGLNTLNLLRFNDSNGQFSNPLAIPDAFAQEFSPNSRYLYVAKVTAAVTFDILQYDLQAPNILNSATILGNYGNNPPSSMQLAPDGKIYLALALATTSSLDRINCPNTRNASIQSNVISLGGAPNYYVLPNFPAWLFENNDSTYVSLGPDTIRLCDVGGSYLLNAQNPGASYLWSTGATTQSITVNTPGIYSVTVSGTCGTGTDRVVVVSCGPPTITGFNIVGDTCNVATNFSFQPIGTSNATSLNWTFDDPNSGANTYVSTPANPNAPHIFSAAGTYNVCLSFQEPGFPVTTICRTVNIGQCCNGMIVANGNCLENSIPFSITTGATATSAYWNFGDPSSGANNTSTSLTPTHLFSATGTYNVSCIVTASCGVDTINKTISIVNCNCIQSIPDAFTPNGDGINDRWIINKQNCFRQVDVNVYNRYGSLVFSKKNYENEWNGTYRSKPLPDGTYYYVVNAIGIDGSLQNLKGNLTILR
jgi:gliding motility-associated-like protein